MTKKFIVVVVAVLTVGIQGCFTVSLWGGDTVDVRDATTGKVETREGWELPLESGRGPDGAEIARRVILTPFALALDFVTIVAQAWLFGTDEDLE